MESAIPPHLTVARSRPTRVPAEFVPAYPSLVARTAESVHQVVMAYFGAEAGTVTEIDVGPDGPRHRDRAPTRLRLYHEVAVAEPDEQWFEFAGCHDRTGLLGAR